MVGNKPILKSAKRAGDMPTDHLPNHGTSACSQTLFLSLSGGVPQYLRGGWEYLRAGLKIYGELGGSTGQLKMCVSIFAHCSTFSGHTSVFTGSSQYLRGVLKTFGRKIIVHGDLFIISGNKKNVYKISGTNVNLRGIFPHMDRHT